MGYGNFQNAVIVEFDFVTTSTLSDPTFPHVSVQYSNGASTTAADNQFSLAQNELLVDLNDGALHNI